MRTFGFRGEALSSLCALSEAFVVNTSIEAPMGVSLEMDANGKVTKRSKIARQVCIENVYLLCLFTESLHSEEPLFPLQTFSSLFLSAEKSLKGMSNASLGRRLGC